MFGFCEMEDEKCESKPQFSSKLSQVYKSSAAYQPGTLTLMQSETFWVSYLFQIPLDLCVYTRNTPKLKKAVGGGTITSPDDIFPQKPIFESNCGVNAPWLAHTARTKQKWNSRFAYLFFFLSRVERMLLLEKLKNNFKKKKYKHTEGHLGRTRTSVHGHIGRCWHCTGDLFFFIWCPEALGQPDSLECSLAG